MCTPTYFSVNLKSQKGIIMHKIPNMIKTISNPSTADDIGIHNVMGGPLHQIKGDLNLFF